MPVMNGCAATRQIRKFNNDVVIIAQSAHVLSVDKEKAMEAGCNDYISKPLNKAILFDLLKKYFLKL
jgi:CheY-like chemotaxis protein